MKIFRKDIRTTKQILQPFYVSYMNGPFEEIDDELVFADLETEAICKILMKHEDTIFVY